MHLKNNKYNKIEEIILYLTYYYIIYHLIQYIKKKVWFSN